MMGATLVSIIFPVYNAEQYIGDCIASLCNQSYPHIEVILVNDGSTDSSERICENAAKRDARVRLYSKINGGVSSARNYGIKKANGKVIVFVDSDDTVSSDYIFNLYDSNFDFVVTGLNIIDTQKISIARHEPIAFSCSNREKIGECLPDLERKILLNGPYQKMFKASIVKEYELFFDETISSGEDTLFVFTYMKYVSSIKILPNCDYNYYRRDNTLSRKRLDYKDAYRYARQMYSLRMEIAKRFHVQSANYLGGIYDLFLTYLFVSLYTLYYKNIPKQKRLQFISQLYAENICLIRQHSDSSISMKNKASCFLMRLNIPLLSDCIYRLVFRLYHL